MAPLEPPRLFFMDAVESILQRYGTDDAALGKEFLYVFLNLKRSQPLCCESDVEKAASRNVVTKLTEHIEEHDVVNYNKTRYESILKEDPDPTFVLDVSSPAPHWPSSSMHAHASPDVMAGLVRLGPDRKRVAELLGSLVSGAEASGSRVRQGALLPGARRPLRQQSDLDRVHAPRIRGRLLHPLPDRCAGSAPGGDACADFDRAHPDAGVVPV